MAGMNEPAIQSGVEEPGATPPGAVSNDPETAELQQRAARGETLSPQQWGKLGAAAKKLRQLFSRGSAPAQPAPAGTGNPLDLAPDATAEAAGDGLPPAPFNPGLCQRTTSAILSRLEKSDKRKTLAAAKLADPHAEEKALARVERSACLPVDDKELLIELSPDALRELGIDPTQYALGIFALVFISWRLDQWAVIEDFKAEAKEREAREAALRKPQTEKPT